MAMKVAEVTGQEPPNIDAALARIMNNVQVSRMAENGSVKLVVENHSSSSEELDITDIVSVEPSDLSEGTFIEMDGEWFVKWSPTVPGGETATLEYSVNGDASFDLDVSGVETAKLTVEK